MIKNKKYFLSYKMTEDKMFFYKKKACFDKEKKPKLYALVQCFYKSIISMLRLGKN